MERSPHFWQQCSGPRSLVDRSQVWNFIHHAFSQSRKCTCECPPRWHGSSFDGCRRDGAGCQFADCSSRCKSVWVTDIKRPGHAYINRKKRKHFANCCFDWNRHQRCGGIESLRIDLQSPRGIGDSTPINSSRIVGNEDGGFGHNARDHCWRWRRSKWNG